MEKRILLTLEFVVVNWENVESVEVRAIDVDPYKWKVSVFFKSGRETVLETFEREQDAMDMLIAIRDDILHCENAIIDSETKRKSETT